MPACDASLSTVKNVFISNDFPNGESCYKVGLKNTESRTGKAHAAVFSFSTSFNAEDSSFYKQNKSQT